LIFVQIALWQVLALSLYAFLAINDIIHMDLGLNRPLFAGFFAGLVMGDIGLGLAIGATLQLMVLGVATFGGSSMPDFMSAALIGTALSVIANEGMEFGIGLAVPVGMLLIQLDVFARFINTFIQHRADAYTEKCELKKIERIHLLGLFTWGLSRALPVAICLIFGNEITQTLTNIMPAWLMSGLKVAGGLLPAVGIAILLKYLPTKKYIPYMLFGFLLAAYLKIPMLGIAIAGAAFAILVFGRSGKQAAVVGSLANEGGMDEDE